MKYGFQKQSIFLVLGCPVFKSIALVVVQFRYFGLKTTLVDAEVVDADLSLFAVNV